MIRFAAKRFALMALALLPALIHAQQNDSVIQKFALVIGNANYAGMSPLANPVNDANDITAVLEHLGFTVDKVLNGSLEQMEDGALRLKERLVSADNAYGFFFYAGHGVQSGGENYLIPVNANIPNENFLRNRAMSVQQVLDDLNDARNALNVVVLDACRDNPFGWSRSGSRGLSIVTKQPADSIIVYATSAGQTASDGAGRNGLYTSQLINNLATPGIEVKEVFNRTGQDVAELSGNRQIPAIYSQFFKTAYLGETPDGLDANPVVGRPQIIISAGRTGRERERDPAKLWSVGASIGSSIADPLLVATARGTLAPVKNVFFEIGFDIGFLSNDSEVGYYHLYPYAHAAYYYPIEKFGVYAGAGGGYMTGSYDFPEGARQVNTFVIDIIVGTSIFGIIDVSYTFKTNFQNLGHKVSAGYTYRFR